MATRHDPNKPNRGYFKQSRVSTPLPPLPPGYNWNKQIEKYCSKDLLYRLYGAPLPRSKYDFPTNLSELKKPPGPAPGSHRFGGVFCHRGFYDQAMKVPENSVLAIDYGFQEYGLRLHELDVKLHTNADKSLNPRKAFLSHDATGARTTAEAGRWSQNDGRDAIGTMLVTRGINLEKNDYASTFQATGTKVPGLESLLFDYDRSTWVGQDGSAAMPQLRPEVYEGSTFQLDVSQPGNAFAGMLAWLRYNNFNNLQVIVKGYNRFYSDGPALVKAVNNSFSLRTGALIDTFRAHNGAVMSAACSMSHMKLATGGRDKTVRIWNFHTSTLEGTLVGHGGAVNSVAFSYQDPWVVSGSDDKTVRIWDFRTGEVIREFKGHKGAVNSVAYSDRNSMVASASDDGNVLLWVFGKDKARHVLKDHKAPVVSVAFTTYEGDVRVVSASYDRTIRFWEPHTGTLLKTLSGHTDRITSMALDGHHMATGSADRTVRIWNMKTGKLLHTLSGHGAPVTAVGLDAEHMHVMSTSNETIHIWHAETGKLQRTVQGHTAAVTSITFGEVGSAWAMITTSSDGEVRTWALRNLMNELRGVHGPKKNIHMGVIMVFYPQPIVDLALGQKGLSLKTTSPKKRLEVLSYERLKNTAMENIKSFIDNPIPEFGQIIPEIVHCGLGLGYDTRRGTAVNPKDGSPISDPELLLAGRLDRAMIEVSLELKKRHPRMIFSSCTRLSDVYYRDSESEFTADLLTGKLKQKPTGQQAIPARLRAIHGGLYPQSDLVVADDPMAEIAARTWIDEYARLDRRQLMTMTYDAWIAQNPKVKEVVDRLNVKFWPNTVGPTPGGAQKQGGIVPAAESQGYRKPPIITADEVDRGLRRALKESEARLKEAEGKRKWWKKS